jgi:hypothetical protein
VPTNGMYLSAANTLNFATNTTNRLTISSTGPATFASTMQATGGKFASANGTTYAATAQLRIDGNGVGNSFAQIVFTDSALMDGKISYFPAAAQANSFFDISARATQGDFVIKGNGYVGIGISPSYQLQLSTDSAAKPTSALWTIASDRRIKENIIPYKKGLQELLRINPITYDYNGLGGFIKGKGGVGIIAQEIIDILPDSVSSIKAKLNKTDEEETNILNFNGHELIYVLINAIKEQQSQIEELKALILVK